MESQSSGVQAGIPVETLSARKSEAAQSLLVAQLTSKFEADLKWNQKRVKHLESEIETGRAKRRELEEQLEPLKHQVAEMMRDAGDIEDWRRCGGERGVRTELDIVKRQLAEAKLSNETLQARLDDGVKLHVEARDANVKLIADLRERLHTAQTAVGTTDAARAAAVRGAEAAAEESAKQLAAAQALAVAAETRAEVAEGRAAMLEAQVAQLIQEMAGLKQGAQQAETQAQRQIGDLKERLAGSESELSQARERAVVLEADASDAKAWRDAGGSDLLATRDALSKTEEELNQLRQDNTKVIYDYAKMRAEHSEMAGRLAKSQQVQVTQAQKLALLRVAVEQIELTTTAQPGEEPPSPPDTCQAPTSPSSGKRLALHTLGSGQRGLSGGARERDQSPATAPRPPTPSGSTVGTPQAVRSEDGGQGGDAADNPLAGRSVPRGGSFKARGSEGYATPGSCAPSPLQRVGVLAREALQAAARRA